MNSPEGDVVLAVSEVRKGDGGRAHLALDDLLGSSRLAYAADAVVLMEEGGEADTARMTVPVVLNVVKGRDGTERRRIGVTFDYGRYRFREPSRRPAKAKARDGAAATTGTGLSGAPPSDPLAGGRNAGGAKP